MISPLFISNFFKKTEHNMYKIFITISLLLLSSSLKSQNWADSVIQKMSLDQKIGQLFMLPAYSNKNEEHEQQLLEAIKKYHIGGIIFFQGTPVKQALMTNRFQAVTKIPLFIGMDAEGGVGWRIKPAIEFPNQTLQGAIRDTNLIFRIGSAIGKQCRTLGIHINFAPVVDININPKNPVIGIRSFGEVTTEVSSRSIAYAKGLASQDVLSVAKHFPGHGDTDVDSHETLPIIRHNKQRLNEVELYPFKQLVESGIPGIMIAHLNVPTYDSTHVPASLSYHVVTELLRNQLHFNGLCFTDALNMKGVTNSHKNGDAELSALLAGNDICLQPANIEQAIKKIKSALKEGRITEEYINEKCLRILKAKEKYVLPHLAPVDTAKLIERLSSPEAQAILQETYAEAITLIKNKNWLLPLTRLDTLHIASLNFGKRSCSDFEETLSKYAPCSHFSASPSISPDEVKKLINQLKPYNCIIVYNSAAKNTAGNSFGASKRLADIIKQLKGKRIIFCHPAIPYGVDYYSHLPMDAILLSYSQDLPAQQFLAQAIFGGIQVNGKLPVKINFSYPAGSGLSTPKVRLGYHLPELSGVNSFRLEKIDSLCNDAIRQKATPGCQVLIVKNGFVIYNKAFGYHTYKKQTPNTTNDIYDLASLTKITATTPCVMQLVDQQKIALDTPIGHYDYAISQSDKKDLTTRELLLHMSGLKASYPFFHHAIDWEKFSGRLFSSRYSKANNTKLREKLYINPRFKYRDSTFNFSGGKDYRMVSPDFYIHKDFQDSIHLLLLTSELQVPKYRYSDIGFVLLKDIVESQTATPFDIFCREQFYSRLGAYHTTFNPYRTLPMENIIPSSEDRIFRKSHLQGYVHDPIAALLGGVSGNAGLFSTAEDLAKIMYIFLNHGQYGGEHYIDSSTIALFTRAQLSPEKNRRGLGFDKPDRNPDKSPACPLAPLSSYGHTGFTGTFAWNDPDNQLIYIFLSNRTYPNEYNTKLIKENIRTRVQEVIYEALLPVLPHESILSLPISGKN